MGRRKPVVEVGFWYEFQLCWDADSETRRASVSVFEDGSYDSSLSDSELRSQFPHALARARGSVTEAKQKLAIAEKYLADMLAVEKALGADHD